METLWDLCTVNVSQYFLELIRDLIKLRNLTRFAFLI